ncbi:MULTISPECIES: hypothetical protein [unclassified Mesorhizobium]|nr:MULTISPECIES: hypothetical protein [unclassified Mesorhizobium]
MSMVALLTIVGAGGMVAILLAAVATFITTLIEPTGGESARR